MKGGCTEVDQGSPQTPIKRFSIMDRNAGCSNCCEVKMLAEFVKS